MQRLVKKDILALTYQNQHYNKYYKSAYNYTHLVILI